MNLRNCTCPTCLGAKKVEADAVRLTPYSRRVTRWSTCPTCGGDSRATRPQKVKPQKVAA